MTFNTQDQRRLQTIRSRFEELQDYIREQPGSEQAMLADALASIGESLQELEVAEEELRQQNDNLFKAQNQIEVERKRYRDLFEFAPDGYLVTTVQGVIVEANRTAVTLYEIGEAGLLGRWIWQFFADDTTRDAVRSALEKMARSSTAREWRVKMTTRQGRTFDADVRVAPTHDPAGSLTELRWLVRDVTEHAQAHEKLRASAQQLAEAQEIAHVGSWEWDIPNDVVTWSREMLSIYGPVRGQDHLTYQDFLSRVHPDDRERTNKIINAAIRSGIPFTFEHRVVRPDGLVRTVLARGRVIVDAQGKSVRMVGTVQDITDSRSASEKIQSLNEQLEDRVIRRTAQLKAANDELRHEVIERTQTEAALRESENRFRLMADTAPVFIWMSGPDGSRTYVNQHWLAFTGRTMEQERGNSWTERVHPDDLQRCLETYRSSFSARQSFNMEYRLRRADGDYRWVFDTGVPRFAPGGAFAGYIGSCTDITDRKMAEQAMQESEQQFRQLAESIDQVFWLGEVNSLRPLYLSPVFDKVFGMPRDKLYENPSLLFDIIHPDDRERVRRIMTDHPDARYSDEFRIVRPDGSIRWIWMRTFPAWGHQGEVGRFVGLIQDITSRVQTEGALRNALERTQELYQISRLIASVRTPADVLHALILSNYLRRINRAAILLFDQPWLDHTPQNCYALASWRGADLVSIEGQTFPFDSYGFANMFAPDQPVQIQDTEVDPRVNETTRAWYRKLKTRSVLLFPLVASGQWYGMLSLHSESPNLVDSEDMRHMRGLADQAAVAIHNIRLLQAEEKARREAEVANDLKMKFLAMISHELRTPLTSIKGFATTLLASDVTWDAESQHDFIVTINQEADKLTDMIDQLLDLSRLEAGTLRIMPVAVTFDDILSTAMAQLNTVTHNHTFVADVSPDLPPLYADRQRIAQVLTNLVSNAAKYSPPKTPITLTARAQDSQVQISVHDEGPGINPDDRSRIFEPFRRGENVERTKGAGLGLAICKHLIEAHGGHIFVQDRDGPGTTMTFTLPLATTPPKDPPPL